MRRKERKRSGRVVFNERGNAIWEWRTQTGTFSSDVDTQRVKALQEQAAAMLGETPNPHGGYDPYSTAEAQSAPRGKKRRTLDDMRRLSEEIQRARKRKGSGS